NFEFQTKNKPHTFPDPNQQKPEKQPEQPQSHFGTEAREKRSWSPEPETENRDVVNEPEVSVLTHEASMEDSALELAKTAERKNYNEERMEQFPELEYIGQIHGTYLLTQNEEGLFIIDQHAAQERIKYEYYKQLLADTGPSMQDLLVPIVLEYPSDEVIIITDHLDKLADAGVKLEPFGQNSFIVREHPTWIIPGQEQGTIEEMIDFFLEKKDLSIGMFREATAIMMSCKRSIKANHHLSDQEAISLIEQLPQAENPYNCPHGRPTLVKMTTRDLEKMFKRIQDSH